MPLPYFCTVKQEKRHGGADGRLSILLRLKVYIDVLEAT